MRKNCKDNEGAKKKISDIKKMIDERRDTRKLN